jgi:hypothetical protein
MAESVSSEPVERMIMAGTELRLGELRLPDEVAQSVAHITPVLSLFFAYPFISGFAGVTTPLAFVFGAVVLAMATATLRKSPKYLASADGYLPYVSRNASRHAGESALERPESPGALSHRPAL